MSKSFLLIKGPKKKKKNCLQIAYSSKKLTTSFTSEEDGSRGGEAYEGNEGEESDEVGRGE
jgi:hypothetical protein